ncbi:MAG: hypothetical protein IH913_03370 [Proteobacteria bacterium]|nr:hypothetical protein [Pseudomonadota bacterium]
MKTKSIILTTVVILLSGCASSKMLVQDNQELVPPVADQSQIVFLRSTFVGSAIQSSVFDVTSGEPEFVGIVSNDTKLAYTVSPGEHVFMVVSEAADFMQANLDAGKTYYSMVTPRMGAWKARFSMHPVRNGGAGKFQYSSERFQGWLERTQFVENTAESIAWFNENAANIKSKQTKYWPVWQQKSPEDLAERTLNPDDGI